MVDVPSILHSVHIHVFGPAELGHGGYLIFRGISFIPPDSDK